ncbi:hypothetical protein ABZX77_31050 [Streptomyces sp. NPDC004237]|uniref:hypothetical protein n=1 Tax=Streptomyces sp. NPDC004237 TaxID=3154455 RepID=UPI0033B0095D
MQSEVVVTLISTFGTVGVAFLTVRGIERKDDRPYIKPLMELGKFCGHATGVAQAVVTECEQVFRRLAENDRPDHVPSAERRISAYRTEARLDDHALVGAEAYDFVRSELDTYVQATRALQRRLEAAGRAIDGLAAVRPPSRADAERALAQHLPGLREYLDGLDTAFENNVVGYFQRYGSFMSMRARRTLRKDAESEYGRFVSSGRRTVFEHLPEDVDGSQGAGAGRVGEDGQPVCGYCIWRCPHAPDLSLVTARAPGAGDHGPAVPNQGSAGPRAVRGGVSAALPAASR